MKLFNLNTFLQIDKNYWMFIKCSKDFQIKKIYIDTNPTTINSTLNSIFDVKISELNQEIIKLSEQNIYYIFENELNIYIVLKTFYIDKVVKNIKSKNIN